MPKDRDPVGAWYPPPHVSAGPLSIYLFIHPRREEKKLAFLPCLLWVRPGPRGVIGGCALDREKVNARGHLDRVTPAGRRRRMWLVWIPARGRRRAGVLPQIGREFFF